MKKIYMNILSWYHQAQVQIPAFGLHGAVENVKVTQGSLYHLRKISFIYTQYNSMYIGKDINYDISIMICLI